MPAAPMDCRQFGMDGRFRRGKGGSFGQGAAAGYAETVGGVDRGVAVGARQGSNSGGGGVGIAGRLGELYQ